MPLAIDIAVEYDAWVAVRDLDGLIERACAAAVAASGATIRDGAELSVVLCNDDTIRALNRDWRGKDSATNVLSFPTDGPVRDHALGDVVVAYETSAAEATAEGLTLDDYLTHLIVHGLFHLLGYDHESDDEAVAMERLESRSLAALGIASPYDTRDAEDPRARP